jgi:hypothetical protein
LEGSTLHVSLLTLSCSALPLQKPSTA